MREKEEHTDDFKNRMKEILVLWLEKKIFLL